MFHESVINIFNHIKCDPDVCRNRLRCQTGSAEVSEVEEVLNRHGGWRKIKYEPGYFGCWSAAWSVWETVLP